MACSCSNDRSRGVDRRRCDGLEKSIGDRLLDHDTAHIEAVHAAAIDQILAAAVITRSRVPAAIVNMQAAAAVSATDDALQQRRAFSHCSSRLVRHRFGIAIEPRLVGFKGGPIDETGMMVADENGPLFHGQMPRIRFLTAPFAST